MRLKPRGCYKCLKKGTPLFSYGINEENNLIDAELFNQKDFFEEGIEVTFASGRKHICTKDHMFKTIDGWETAKVGLRNAVSRKIPSKYKEFNEAEEYLVGLLVGDGCLNVSTPRLSCYNDEILDKLYNYGFQLNNIAKGDYSVLKVSKIMIESNLVGTNSWTKFIPKKYEGSPHFLRGLFDADASVCKNSNRIVFVTVSERLADDVIRNLHYFGIVARKHYYEYPKSDKSPEVKCYHISLYGEDLIKYRDNIGFICKHKKDRLDEKCGNIFGSNNNVNTISSEWKKLLKYDEKRKLRYDAGIRIDNRYAHSPKKVLRCGEYLNNQDVIDIANADIFWDRIISIKDVGMQEFSAIGSDIENYISQDGIIHHNTTVYGIGFILWVWGCISPDIRIFYTSSNAMLLEEVADSVSRYIGDGKSETIYSYIFGITKDLTAKNTSDVFNISGRTGKGFSLILRTSGGSTQGIHPNIIIVDDPLGQKDRESQAERDSKIRWFDTLNPLLTPWIDKNKGIVFESIFYIGTRWHMKDLVDYIVNELNDKLPELLRWDIEIESIFTKDKEPSYPEFFPLEKIMAMKATMSDEFFSCQMENNPLTEQLMIFNLKKLSFIREEQFDLSQGELLCVFDPSLGKKHSDYPAVWWVNYYNDRVVFFDAIDEKVEISLIVHQIAAKNQKYSCRHMIFEDNGILLVEQALQDAHSRINHRIYIESVHHSSNKEERIMSMQPDLYSGFGVFMEDYKTRYPEAMNQIIFYPVYGHDDFPDCAQIAIEHYRKPHFQFKRYEEIL